MLNRILLLGDSCIDRYVYGACSKFNQEAPVPIIDFKKTYNRDGMAKNVFNNLKAFGLNVNFLTNKKKIIKTRFIDVKNNQQILRVDNDIKINSCSIRLDDIEKYDVIIISDYNKGFITEKLIFDITSMNKIVFIDSKKTKLPKENCYIKINRYEYEKLKEKELHKNLIVTQGKMGAFYNKKLFKTKKIKNANIIGAGDTFLAGLAFAFIKTNNIEESINFANLAAYVAVSNSGTYVLTKSDIDSLRNCLDLEIKKYEDHLWEKHMFKLQDLKNDIEDEIYKIRNLPL
jgi:D-beta-D-heptose 7-phosphate kinase/D-beta-D-heptose 1-phosphate adenosyltransferase